MANKHIFQSAAGISMVPANALNKHRAPAHAYEWRHLLAQLAMTSTFNDRYYGKAGEQVADLLTAAEQVDVEFLARTAVYARKRGYMKDAPALLLAILSSRSAPLFHQVFDRVIDNGKLLRGFVQIMRSGAAGRRSLGTAPRHRIQTWLNEASDWQLLNAAVGTEPSLADVLKMVHPKPISARREALFAWILRKPCDSALLPEAVQALIALQCGKTGRLPDVPMQMLTSLPLDARQWAKIARRASWQTVRMNLNTFARQGVFGLRREGDEIASKLTNERAIRAAKAMPYQIMIANTMLDERVPKVVREALVKALDLALENTPRLSGRVVVCPDVSASMSDPVTGHRRGATTAVRCVDVAALYAAAIVSVNRDALVLPFDTRVREVELRADDSVLETARKLARNGGGTDCTAPLRWLNESRTRLDTVIFISDNQSWAHQGNGRNTPMMLEWRRLKRHQPAARMVCIDIAPYGTTQAPSREDILNIGGFSDSVFDLVAAFAAGKSGEDYWVKEIEQIEL